MESCFIIKSKAPWKRCFSPHNCWSFCRGNKSLVELKEDHSKIVRIEKNGNIIFLADKQEKDEEEIQISIKEIYDFANLVKIEDIRTVISRQIEYNLAICLEGLNHTYGQNIGQTLIEIYGDDVKIRARALAAAGSDARMSGCGLPVIINSGSGEKRTEPWGVWTGSNISMRNNAGINTFRRK